ncbi:unnamed protein product, partial [Closterium sp. NIES-54]
MARALPLQPARRLLAARPPPLAARLPPLAARFTPPLQPVHCLATASPVPCAARLLPALLCAALLACYSAMASLRVLTFDHEGRPIQFDTWLDELQLYLMSDSRDSVSLFDHTSGASLAPPATPDSATRSQWLTHDATARLAIRKHLPLAECAHFGQHKTAKALYDVVVARYSPLVTAALGRLILPYLFPELSAFAIVEDLVTHLCTSDARNRAALLAEFLAKPPPPPPPSRYLTVHLLEQHLLAAETSDVAVGAARGTPRTPFFEGCSPSPLAPSYAYAAAVASLVLRMSGLLLLVGSAAAARERVAEVVAVAAGVVVGAAVEVVEVEEVVAPMQVVEGVRALVAAVGVAVVAAVGVVAVGLELFRGEGLEAAATPSKRDPFALAASSGVAIFDLDYDAILATKYALSVSAEGDCYMCVPPDPGIEAAALGASESALPGTAPAEALHTFTLDSGAARCFFRDSTTLTPLSALVPVRLADPSGGPILARSSTVLPCSSVPTGSLSSLHLPSFSTNLRSTATLQDAMVTTTTPGGQRVSICHVHSSAWVDSVHPGYRAPLGSCVCPGFRVRSGSTPPARLASCHTRLSCGTTDLVTPPCHAFMACTPASLSLVFPGLCLPSRPRLPHPAFLASRGGSAPLLTPPRFPRRLLPCKPSTWTCGAQPRCEFSSHLLRDFCRGEGILQSFTLQASPQQNGIAERCIGFIMELNLWPHVSLLETSPTLRWTWKVGDASAFRLFHPTSRRVLPSQDVTFDKLVPFYRLFPYRSAPPPPSSLFLAPGPPPVDPLPPQGPAPLGVSQVDPLLCIVPVEVAVDSGAARGAASGGCASGGAEPARAEPGGAEPAGAEPGGAESEGAGSGGAEHGGTELAGAEPEDAQPGGAEPEGAELGGAEYEGVESGGAEPRGIASSG